MLHYGAFPFTAVQSLEVCNPHFAHSVKVHEKIL